MNRQEAKELLPIIQAFAEGKIKQKKKHGEERYYDSTNSNLNFVLDHYDYRIKAEPKYRSFANAEECWQEMQKHQPFGWMKYQCDFLQIIHVDDNSIGYGSACGVILHSKFEDIFKNSTFADGTPFGIKEED